MFKSLIDWYLSALESGSYPLIALLMAIESSVVPLPSELVIPPAAHLAYTTGRFSMVGIVLAGALGSWVGATAMYWAARWGGRPLVMRFGRYVLITPQKVEGAERWAAKFGPVGVFISRLLPVVRMDYVKFSLYTLLGSAIWSAVLCYLGVKMGQDEQLMRGELHRITLWLGGAVVVLGSLYYFLVHRQMKAENA
jgi:membrane protein DedA with SNARE-associated domain